TIVCVKPCTDVANSKGLKTASQVLLSGVSAGAEAVVTLCDQLPALVPSAKTTKCLMDSGFFLGAFTLPILLHPSNIQLPSASWTRASFSVSSLTLAGAPPLFTSPFTTKCLMDSGFFLGAFTLPILLSPPFFNHQVPHGLGILPRCVYPSHTTFPSILQPPSASWTRDSSLVSRISRSILYFWIPPPLPPPSASWTPASSSVSRHCQNHQVPFLFTASPSSSLSH
ncbi:unnamed protein product, partial [Closterium sp. NIES-53]